MRQLYQLVINTSRVNIRYISNKNDMIIGTNAKITKKIIRKNARKQQKQMKSKVDSIKIKEFKEISQKPLPNTLFSVFQGNPMASVAHELKTEGVGFKNVHNILHQLEAVPRKSKKLSSAYARLFTQYYKSSDYNIELLHEIFTSFLERGNPTRTHITLMMTAFSKYGYKYINDAMELWKLMRKKKIMPDRVSYNVVLKLVGNVSGDIDSMLTLFDEMKNNDNIKPDATTYSTVIDALGHTERIDDALNIFQEFKAASNVDGSHYIVYCSMMTALSCHGEIDQVEKLFNEMIDLKWQINEIAFRALAMAHARVGDSQGTELVLKRLQNAGLKPTRPFFIALIGAYARQGDAQGAIDAYQSMKLDYGLKPNEDIAHALVDAVGFCGNLSIQNYVYERLCEEKLIEPMKNGVLDVRKYTIHGVKVPLNYYFNKYEREYRMGTEAIPAKGLHIIVGLGKPNFRDFPTQSWPRTTVTSKIAIQWLRNFKPRLNLKVKDNKNGLVVVPRITILEAFRARKTLVKLEEEAEIMASQALRRQQT